MPKEKYVPKHRDAPVKSARTGPSLPTIGLKNAAVLSGVAVAATGLAVSAGVVQQGPIDGAAVALGTTPRVPTLTAADLAQREAQASRSDGNRIAEAKQLKSAALSNASGHAVTHTEDLSTADPRTLAQALMPQYGLSSAEFSCLDHIWVGESGWNLHAQNPSSGAYGIPQALPGSKMASAGPNWQNDAETQIRWGLGYIKSRYGTACSAWSFKQSHGWY